jgi:hypothetical protein
LASWSRILAKNVILAETTGETRACAKDHGHGRRGVGSGGAPTVVYHEMDQMRCLTGCA